MTSRRKLLGVDGYNAGFDRSGGAGNLDADF